VVELIGAIFEFFQWILIIGILFKIMKLEEKEREGGGQG